MNEDKFGNTADKLAGQAKEGLGKLTGDKEQQTEGKVEKGKADLKDKANDLGDSAKGALGGLTGDKNN